MSRQGSASYQIVIGGITTLVVGALLLTFLVYPIINSFTNAAFWSADTASGARVVMFTEGIWVFSGGIIMLALVAWIWIRTRQ